MTVGIALVLAGWTVQLLNTPAVFAGFVGLFYIWGKVIRACQ